MFKKKRLPDEQTRVRRPQYGGSAKVFSYHAKKARLEEAGDTAKGTQSSRKNRLMHIPGIIAGILILVSVAYNLILNTNPRVIVEGQAGDRLLLEPEETYDASATEVLGSSILNRTKLTINTQKLHEQVTAKHPELAAVRVSLPLIGHRPILYITPSVPFLVLHASSGERYVLDRSGKVITQDTSRLPEDTLAVMDDSGLQFNVGEQALASDDIVFIQEVIRQLNAKDISVSELELPAGSQSLHVRIEGERYFIKFTFQGDVRVQAGAFIAAHKKMAKDKVKPKQYIDVRAGERVYYK